MKKNSINTEVIKFIALVFVVSSIVLITNAIIYKTTEKREEVIEQTDYCKTLLAEKEKGMNIRAQITNKVRDENGGVINGFFFKCEKRREIVYCFKKEPPRNWMLDFNFPREFVAFNKTVAGTIESINDLIKKNVCE